jgi:hypothetical protein
MFIQPAGEKKPCLIDRDCVSFHQSMRCACELAVDESLFDVVRQLKRTHPNFCSYRILTQTHHIPTVAKQYHWRKLPQNNVTNFSGVIVGDFRQRQGDSSPTSPLTASSV